ncbi:MAG: TaqI-like C-terminal specificity domain-containing protein [Bacteroidota bacterium]|nr:TaqI-like C-terminal specificity domain-containing protein [Bacteroidota bacterium]
MKLNLIKPRKALNKAFLKVKPNRSEIENFKANLITLLDTINENESEEFHKNIVSLFLKDTYYKGHHFINTKERTDLVIHNGSNAKSAVGVILETKKPTNKTEMLRKDKINTKALHELVLYYLRERINQKNLELKYIVATNIYEWFIFDAAVFEKFFAENKTLVKQFKDFEEERLSNTKTDFFYKEIAEPAIEKMNDEIECTWFDIRDYEKPLRNNDPKDDNKLIALYKLLSPEHLLKLPFANDSNNLDKSFYTELLHIIGLKETKAGSKKLIGRKPEGERDSGSLIENTITILTYEDHLSHIKASNYGETQDEQLYNVALELVITWINRILFLKLLEGQLIKYHLGDNSYKFLNFERIPNYDKLNKLFFQVLAIKENERNELVKKEFEKVPYLNSSLFEPNELEGKTVRISNLEDEYTLPVHHSTVLRDKTGKRRKGEMITLEYFLRFLDAYDFAGEGAEDIQEDNKTLINASVLGLIFEKINGYKDGSFFTPGFITMYMARETIRRAVVQKFNEEKNWNCQNFNELYDKIDDKKEANQMINSLKICDPAVGSGHFLVSALNEIIALKSELKVLLDAEGKTLRDYHVEVQNDELIITDEDGRFFEYHPNNRESQRIQETLFHEKQTIIENCLFGVDINPNSVKICRLRLWIELLKNAYYRHGTEELETLPNIDINIKAGNSLISRYPLDADIKKALKKSKWTIDSYRIAVMTYRNAKNRDEKRAIQKLIGQIKNDFESEIAANDKRVIRLNKLKGELFALTTQTQLFDQTKKEKAEWNKKVNKLTETINKLETELEEIKNNKIYENAFEWRFEFPEVLNDNGNFVGFDVVIGNPPYFSISSDSNLKSVADNYLSYNASGDIYGLFYEKAINISKKYGFVTYITSNRFCQTNYGEKTRSYLSSFNLIKLINFNEIELFEDANVHTIIVELGNEKPKNNYVEIASIKGGGKNKLNADSLNDYIINVEKRFFNNKQWIFYPNEILKIKDKIETTGSPFISIEEIFINRGVTTGANYAFIINNDIKNELIEQDKNSIDLIKPILKGSDIKRYSIKDPSNWIVFTRRGTDIEKYPAIKEYLSKFKEKLTPGVGRKAGNYKWFEIQDNTAFYKEFEKTKIVWTRLSNINSFAMSYNNEYTLDSTSFATYKYPEYLCGILNSKVIFFYFKLAAVIWGKDGIKWFGEYFDTIPIPNASDKQISVISDLVRQITNKKQHDPESDISCIENQIDQLVYQLYGLTEEEIEIVEKS